MAEGKRRLVIVSQVYVPDPASVGQHVHDAAAEMARRGWDVRVYASARGYDDPARKYPARETLDGVTIRRLPLSSFGKGSIAARLAGGFVFLLQASLHVIFGGRVDAILASTSPPMCGIFAAILSKLKRAPVSFWAMDINPDQMVVMGKVGERSLAARAFDVQNRAILRRSRAVIALDRFMAERLERKTPVAKKTTIIPPWPHIETIDDVLPHAENRFRAEHGLEGKFVIMYSGNMSPAHPVQTLLEASLSFADREELVLMFIGGGNGKAAIEAFIAEHKPQNVRLLPYQPLSELRYSLSAADVHLVAMGDPMVGVVHPCKVYGAMAVGRPILFIGPRPSHVSDILDEHGVGWHVAHGDLEGMEQTVETMLSTEGAALEAMGRKAQSVVADRFSKQRLCGAFCDALEATVRQPAGSTRTSRSLA